MEKFIRGDVIVVPFPFSDLSSSKRRQAFVLSELIGDDIILCQITGKQKSELYTVNLNESDFIEGSLNLASNIHPNRIFTADKRIICYKVGSVSEEKLKEVQTKIFNIFLC